jgi:hypothetical protein
MGISRLKRSLGLVVATAALSAALPAGNAIAGQCSYQGAWYEKGERIVTNYGSHYECISYGGRMYWQFLGTSPGTGPWQP